MIILFENEIVLRLRLINYRPEEGLVIIMEESESDEESKNGDSMVFWSGKRAGLDSGKQVRCSFVDNAEYISMI